MLADHVATHIVWIDAEMVGDHATHAGRIKDRSGAEHQPLRVIELGASDMDQGIKRVGANDDGCVVVAAGDLRHGGADDLAVSGGQFTPCSAGCRAVGRVDRRAGSHDDDVGIRQVVVVTGVHGDIGDVGQCGGVMLIEGLTGGQLLIDVDDANLTEESTHHGVGQHCIPDSADPDNPELMWLDGHRNLLQSSRSTFAVHAYISIIHQAGFNFVTPLRRSGRAVRRAWPSPGRWLCRHCVLGG